MMDFKENELIQLIDEKGRVKTFVLKSDKVLHTHKGGLEVGKLVGKPEGTIIQSEKGANFQAFRPKRSDAILSLPRGAAIIYPKDSAAILTYGDIFPGAKVLEAGLGSGGLTIQLLSTVGKDGKVVSIERREDFLKTAQKNVSEFFNGAFSGGDQIFQSWQPQLSELSEYLQRCDEKFDRIILDLLNPWDFVNSCENALINGGILTCYVTTTPQLQELAKAFLSANWVNVEAFEIMRRPWKLEDLSIRPEHQGILHSGWIVCAKMIKTARCDLQEISSD